MELNKILEQRKSCKDFSSDKVPADIIENIIKAGNLSPIGTGKPENIHLTIINSKEILDEIDKSAAIIFKQPDSHPLYNAPVLIVISAYDINDRSRMTYGCTAGCIAENMMLEAVNLGVGAVCMTGIIRAINNNKSIFASLNLPEGFAPIFSVAFGYPANIDDTVISFDAEKIKKNYV